MEVLDMTEEEMRKEIITDLSKNMFVEAGAGAGKTTMIVERVMNLLKQGADPAEIVVITFTNAAAEELRRRLTDRLAEEAAKDTALREKFLRLDRMNISTIHSFCMVLLQEQGLLAGLPQGITVMEEKENREQKEAALNAYLRTLKRADWKKLEEDGDKKGERYKIRNHIAALYTKIAELPKDMVIHQPKADTMAADLTRILDKIRAWIDGDTVSGKTALEENILLAAKECVDSEKAQKKPWEVQSLAELTGMWEGSFASDALKRIQGCLEAEPRDYDALCLELLDPVRLFLKSKAKSPLDKEKIDGAEERFQNKIRSILSEAEHELIGKNREWIKKLKEDGGENHAALTERLAVLGRNEVYFADVLHHAMEAREYYRGHAELQKISNERLLERTRDLLLQEDGRAHAFFADKYRYFFVDEFQDTDRMQESFIYRLATDPGDAEHTRLREGALFLVGDPKQSIYRFRGAQPEVYFDVKRRMKEADNAAVYELQRNYRSVSGLIGWINDRFTEAESITPIIAKEISEEGYRKMEPVRQAAGGDVIWGIYRAGYADAFRNLGKKLRVLKTKSETVDHLEYNECRKEEEAEKAKWAAEKTAELIFLLMQKDSDGQPCYQITDYDKEDAPFKRAICPKDFLVITQKKKYMEYYVRALQRLGIPVLLDGKENLTRDRSLIVFVRLFGYLVKPRDLLSRTAAEEALRETLECEDEKEFQALSEGLLECLLADTKEMSVYGKAVYLERQVSLLFDKESDTGRLQARVVQSHIRQMLETLFAEENCTGVEMAQRMRDHVEAGLEHELSLEEDPDAVRLMNLHKTKGLEGNIVIIADRTGKRKNFPLEEYRDGTEYYPGIHDWSMARKDRKLADKAEKENAAEFHRLEYVAATRAKQAVIFMDVLQKGGIFATAKLSGKKGLTPGKDAEKIYTEVDKDTYSYRLDSEKDLWADVKSRIPDAEALVQKAQGRQSAAELYAAGEDDYPEGISKAVYDGPQMKRESPSNLEKKASKIQSAAVEKAKADGRERKDEIPEDLNRPIGNVTGNVLHRTMELLVGRCFALHKAGKNRDEAVMEACCRQAVLENAEDIRTEAEKKDIAAFTHACAAAYAEWFAEEIGWEKVEAVYPEVRFSYREPDVKEVCSTGEKTDPGEGGVWMNGTADLILQMKDGSVRLIDYKSDNDHFLTEEQMREVLKEKYTPQLSVYHKVICDMLHADAEKIHTGVVSFSQKDGDGSLLTGKQVRVRYTELDVRN